MHRALVSIALASALIASSPARADERQQCVAASESGQRLRQEGKYVAARDAFGRCARSSCPGLVQRDCTRWLEELTDTIPSIVVAAKDEQGRDVDDVRVLVDGKLAADRLDGRAIAVDPGIRTIRLERTGDKPIVWKGVVREGEKRRLIGGTFAPLDPFATMDDARGSVAPANAVAQDVPAPAAPSPAPPKPEEPSSAPVLPWIMTGVGAAALTTGVVWYVVEDHQIDVIYRDCLSTGNCSTASSKADQTKAIVLGAVGFGVLGAGVVLLLTHSSKRGATIAPVVAPQQAGLALSGRF